jgi:uncharacterized membrane protein YebE (DUF533 family)
MTDISRILTAVLSGGTQPGGQGGVLGQLGQTQAGGAPPGGLDALLRGLSGAGQQAPAGGTSTGGTLFDQLATALRSGQGGADAARAQAAPGGGSPGGSLLDQLMAVVQGAQQKAGAAMAGAAGTPLGDMLNQAGDLLKKHGGGFAGGAAAGTLAGLLLGTGAGRKIAGAAARLGGLAAIGGLAYVALRNFQQGKPVVEGTINDVSSILGLGKPPEGFAEAAGSVDDTAEILLRAMVAGAYSDGMMTPEERQAIVGQLDSMGLGTAEKSYLEGMLAAPVSMKLIAAACVTDEMKAQAYIAAQMGIDVDTDAERQFLKDFAAALGLAPGLVAHLDQAAAEARAARDA